MGCQNSSNNSPTIDPGKMKQTKRCRRYWIPVHCVKITELPSSVKVSLSYLKKSIIQWNYGYSMLIPSKQQTHYWSFPFKKYNSM